MKKMLFTLSSVVAAIGLFAANNIGTYCYGGWFFEEEMPKSIQAKLK